MVCVQNGVSGSYMDASRNSGQVYHIILPSYYSSQIGRVGIASV